jgi:rRNA maturation endonuclease Nob1
MLCRNYIRYKVDRPTKGGKRYLIKQKRCHVCQIFIINWQGLFCPCCGGRLRNKPK